MEADLKTPLLEPLERILARIANNLMLARKLREKFNAEAIKLRDNLFAARAADDYKGAVLASHSLKGMSGTLGALRLQSYAAILEAQTRENRMPDDAQCAELSALIEQTIAALNALSLE